MADEKSKSPEQEVETDDVIDTIKQLKETTVSKDIHDKEVSKLQAERKRLLDIIKSGGEDDEQEKSVEELRENLRSNKLNNLDFVENALSLRKKVLEDKGVDIFEASGHTVDKQLVNGERVAEFLQNCIDKSDGKSEVFTAILQSNLVEPQGLKNLKK